MTLRKRLLVLAHAGIKGLVCHDLRATYGTRLGEGGFHAYDIAKLMDHANISTSQRYIRNSPVGAVEAVILKTQCRHNTVTSERFRHLVACGKVLILNVAG
jgi:integrase